MKTRIRFEDFAAEEELWDGNEISLEVPNADMMPTVRDFYDTVTIAKPAKRIKKNDVVVYRNNDGQLVLSRIVFVNNGMYTLSPDGKRETEYNIADSQVVGVMISFERKGKIIASDNKHYLYYLSVLPIVKAIYVFYSSLKTKVQSFIKYLFNR